MYKDIFSQFIKSEFVISGSIKNNEIKILNNTKMPFTMSAMAVSKQFNKLCKFYKIQDGRFHDLRRQALTNFMIEKKLGHCIFLNYFL